MTPEEQTVMTLGRELDILNRVRAQRVRLLRCWGTEGAYQAGFTAAALAGFNMGTAYLDQRRRQIRAELAAALEVTQARAVAVLPGRHRAPLAVADPSRWNGRPDDCYCIGIQRPGEPWAIGIADPRCPHHGDEDHREDLAG